MSATATYAISSRDIVDQWNSLCSFVQKKSGPVKKEGWEFVDSLNKNFYAPSVEWAAKKAGLIFDAFVNNCCANSPEESNLRKYTAKVLSFDALSAYLSYNAASYLFGSLSFYGLLFWGGIKLVSMIAIQANLSSSDKPEGAFKENFLEVCDVPVLKNLPEGGLKSLAGGIVSRVTSFVVRA